MLRIVLTLLFFIVGATLGHYFPLNIRRVNLYDIPMKDIGWPLNQYNGYLQTHIDGTIESLDMSSGIMTVLYHPGYMPRDKKLIKINFFPDIKVDDRANILENSITIFYKTLPQTLNINSLSVGSQVAITLMFDKSVKKIIATSIIKTRKIQES